ncbi:MAG: polysaccharide biosynthesis/export family protein [Candidatus Acidiferrales bacterium]
MSRIKIWGLAALLMAVPAGLGAQQSNAVAAATKSVSAPPGSNSGQSDDRPALEQRNPRYRIMRDDMLNLSFPLSPELNQTVTVQPDGYITLVNVGSLFVQGMTVPEITQAIEKAYAKILHDPIINVDLKDFQKPFFVVSGQVAKPGQYDLRYDTTASEAIAVAGGLMPTAKTQVLIFHRVSSGWMEVKKFNLKDILNGKHVNEDAVLQPGDMIFVPEKFITNFRKYVPYSLGLYSSINPATL